jgi:ribosomal protein S18 acetylase RimI-like enzyme
MSMLPSFPRTGDTADKFRRTGDTEDKSVSLQTPALLIERGFCLRRAQDSDLPQLNALYADTRAEEMSSIPWSLAAKQSFLEQQFALQHVHYVKHYPSADFLVMVRDASVQGRFYLDSTATELHIIDICLLAKHRGMGIGTSIIAQTQREAHATHRGMHLHVLKFNIRALALYQRLGFVLDGGTDTHHRMVARF